MYVAGQKAQIIDYLCLLLGFKTEDLFLIKNENDVWYQLIRLPASSFIKVSYPAAGRFNTSAVTFRGIMDQAEKEKILHYLYREHSATKEGDN